MIDPFFVVPDAPQPPTRRLLLISYIFPPERSVGALRWQKMLPYFATRGWQADVITVRPTHSDGPVNPGLQELPPGTRVFGIPNRPPSIRHLERAALAVARRIRSKGSLAPTSNGPKPPTHGGADRPDNAIPASDLRWALATPRGWARTYFGWIEHAEIGRWARAAAALGTRLHRARPYDVVATSGPPHMTHEAGRLIAAATHLPFVMDLRDPWSVSERVHKTFASPLWLHLARHHETRIVSAAALVVANTEPLAERESAQFPHARRVIAITNGADDEPLPPSRQPGRFSIRYAGTIYTDADPMALFRAAARVIRELALSPSEFGLDLIGNFGDDGGAHIMSLAASAGVDAYTTVGAHRPRQDALDFLAQAAMLVTFPGVNVMLTIPAKVFECLRFDAWLLVLAPPGSAAAIALAGTSADVVPIEDEAEIARRIAARVLAHRRGEHPTALGYDQRFTRRFQATRLADALESLPARASR